MKKNAKDFIGNSLLWIGRMLLIVGVLIAALVSPSMILPLAYFIVITNMAALIYLIMYIVAMRVMKKPIVMENEQGNSDDSVN